MSLKQKVGVVIGRFQVASLHAGHHHLITTAMTENSSVLVVVGSGRGLATRRYPLPYQVRKQMIQSAYPAVRVVEHFDNPSDQSWSKELDKLIREQFSDHEVTLYGSRDSFIPYYHGDFKTSVVADIASESGTEQRSKIIVQPPATTDFRAGIIYREETRLPISYQAVDIAILRGGGREILLGQKTTDGDFWRLPGGFVDPTVDHSLEWAAKREAREEVGDVELAEIRYRGSLVVDDWRYRREADRVMTALFSATYIFGHATAGDDLAAVRWFTRQEAREVISPTHLPLLDLLDSQPHS
jgi:bifunctional NMN adenylyltransferase/nudix hydrolase